MTCRKEKRPKLSNLGTEGVKIKADGNIQEPETLAELLTLLRVKMAWLLLVKITILFFKPPFNEQVM